MLWPTEVRVLRWSKLEKCRLLRIEPLNKIPSGNLCSLSLLAAYDLHEEVHLWSQRKWALLWSSLAETRNYLTVISESLPYRSYEKNLSNCLGTDSTSQTWSPHKELFIFLRVPNSEGNCKGMCKPQDNFPNERSISYYQFVQKLMSSRLLSQNVKIRIYRNIIFACSFVWVWNLVSDIEGGA
jgi:hypothetical protein